MLITRKSPVTGLTHEWEIPVTREEILEWEAGTLIQDAMSHLTADQREFIMTGITPSEWDGLFPNRD